MDVLLEPSDSARRIAIIPSDKIVLSDQSTNVDGESWLHVPKATKHGGWVRVGTELGGDSLELVDSLDLVRAELRGLPFEALRRQATSVGASAQELEATSPNICFDWRHETVELIIDCCVASKWTVELKELPDGWNGVESAPLEPGDRVFVHIVPAELSEDGDAPVDLAKARGNVVRKIPSFEDKYEVRLDGMRQTMTLLRRHLKKCAVDETKAHTLFEALLADDVTQLRWLIDEMPDPPDAIDANGNPVSPGTERVVRVRSARGYSLLQVATDRSDQCSRSLRLLRERLMIHAVVQDDVSELQNHLDSGGALDTLDADGTPMIELARQHWERAGAANTHEIAEHLGGRCWFELSMRWETAYGVKYDARKHANANAVSSMQAVLTTKQMANVFKAQEATAEKTKHEIEDALHWKKRNAFMTRKGT